MLSEPLGARKKREEEYSIKQHKDRDGPCPAVGVVDDETEAEALLDALV